MNVSSTEDATISLTRLERGDAVVREVAIVIVPAQQQAILNPGFELGNKIIARPAVSLIAIDERVNRKQ